MTTDEAHDADLRTVDELAAAAGLSVRTTRYYASLGLLPPPARRGRMAWYDDTHLARLQMIRALQGHGFTLQAIEKYLGSLPDDAGLDELAVQRAMLTSWTAGEQPTAISRRQLEQHAGRALSDDDLVLVEDLGLLHRSVDDQGRTRFTPAPGFDIALELVGLDIPVDGVRQAVDAITRHMDALAGELTVIFREQVLGPWRRDARLSREDAEQFESTLSTLRRLTLEAIVRGFQRSANDLITRSLERR